LRVISHGPLHSYLVAGCSPGVRCPYATAKAEAAAPKATEAATAAPRSIAGTPTHGYEPRREAATAGS
jgi:hypothetical protein